MPALTKRFIFTGTLLILLAACGLPGTKLADVTPTPGASGANPYAPQPGDDSLVRGPVDLVKTELLSLQTYPTQIVVKLSFFTPTPCHQFRVTAGKPDSTGRIDIEIYSLMKKDQVCSLMRTTIPTEADLKLGSLPSGHYTVWVNRSQATEFEV